MNSRANRDIPFKKRFLSSPSASPKQAIKKLRLDTVKLFKPIFAQDSAMDSAPCKDIFKETLRKFFASMLNDVTGYHFSEVLRLIADFHRDSETQLTPENRQILQTVLNLYEKASVIEPRSTNPMNSRRLLTDKITGLITLPGNLSYEIHERSKRYQKICANYGFNKYFWSSIDIYIAELSKTYRTSTNQALVNLLKYLASSPTIEAMIHKHVPAAKIEKTKAYFTRAIEQLTSDHTQVLRRV